MTKFYSNKELSKKLSIPLTKIRRYANTILDPDEEATRQSGKSRRHSKREALQIYLCGHMIAKMGLTMNEAKVILQDLSPWLELNGLYPDSPKGEPDDIFYADSFNDQLKEVSAEFDWYYPIDIQIMRANTPSGFYYITIKEIPDSRKTRKIKGKQITEIQFEEGYILPPDNRYVIDELNIFLLKISSLIYDFKHKIKGMPRI